MVNIWEANLPKLLQEKNRVTNLCHGLSSNTKAFVAWDVNDSIADLRRACGGFGYAKYSIIDEFLNINDLNQTWEGDNHVLLMQTQQFLFKCMRWMSKGEQLPETVEFISPSPPDLEITSTPITDIDGLIEIFSDRANYFVHQATAEMMKDPTKIAQNFEAAQAFEMRDMCQAYHDYYILTSFTKWIDTISDANTKDIFKKFLLVCMHKKIIQDQRYFSHLFEFETLSEIKKSLVQSLKELRKDIISLTDVIPYPNIMMGALGNEDLQIYDRILQHVKATPKVTERASWWKMAYHNSDAS